VAFLDCCEEADGSCSGLFTLVYGIGVVVAIFVSNLQALGLTRSALGPNMPFPFQRPWARFITTTPAVL
jgi:hypothetical protein